MSKLCASTLRWAFSIARLTQAFLDRLALLHAQALHQPAHPLGGEDAHQVVFQRQEETARARVALAPGAPAQLVVDAA
jgi:hypothetical protein